MATPLEAARRNLIADVIAAIIGNDIEHVQSSMSIDMSNITVRSARMRPHFRVR
ncbi:MAG: hypothetical protein JOZ12_00540 [Sinobacteraceae bacterium]|nr:hypothetical protein [Nevskiaceae bacterium]